MAGNPAISIVEKTQHVRPSPRNVCPAKKAMIAASALERAVTNIGVFISRRVGKFDDHRRRIVSAGALYCLRDELLSAAWLSTGVEIRMTSSICDPRSVNQAVRADEKPIARLMGDRPICGSMNCWPAPSACWGVAPRMGARLTLVELAFASQPANMAVVMGELGETAVAREIVNTTVSTWPKYIHSGVNQHNVRSRPFRRIRRRRNRAEANRCG